MPQILSDEGLSVQLQKLTAETDMTDKQFIKLLEFVTVDREKHETETQGYFIDGIDEIANKPWRAIRFLREYFTDNAKPTHGWYKDVVLEYSLLEEFYSNGGREKIRELMVDPTFNVNYPDRIISLTKGTKL